MIEIEIISKRTDTKINVHLLTTLIHTITTNDDTTSTGNTDGTEVDNCIPNNTDTTIFDIETSNNANSHISKILTSTANGTRSSVALNSNVSNNYYYNYTDRPRLHSNICNIF